MIETTAVSIRTCAHVRADGSSCRSAAMRADSFCYFHRRDRQRRPNLRPARPSPLGHGGNPAVYFDREVLESFAFPVLADANAIQACLSILLRAIASGQVPRRRAGQLLYTLQLASQNLKFVTLNPPDETPLVAVYIDPPPSEES